MKAKPLVTDGNEAAARVAYAVNEVIAIYPITPASPMGELCDAWASQGQSNLWGIVPEVIEMQSEGGAAGALHGALQTGALATTFTASQGLLLMIPNMYKIAGELTPAVIHVAARSVATHALSIFGDHSDVMATRATGWAMLASNTVQEAHDFAMIAQAATLASRVPFLHFFDGFRTSHELNRFVPLDDDEMRAMLPAEAMHDHVARAMHPDRPVLRGSAQNPDVFFQAREAINPFYDDLATTVAQTMERFGDLTGRNYQPFEYMGSPNATRVLVLMGSGAGASELAVEHLVAQGEDVGLLKVRLYRPFSVSHMLAVLPASTRRIAVLDRTKEPGSIGEPLYMDVVTALAQSWTRTYGASVELPLVVGGRYGLSSKEFTPSMVAAVFRELSTPDPKHGFTVGIRDDISHLSLAWNEGDIPEDSDTFNAVFFGLGSDGTVGANKSTTKIVGENTQKYAQGYFVYDSKKSGSMTVSHLRFSADPIRETYQVQSAQFVACHQFQLLERMAVLDVAQMGSTFLLNSPYGPDEVWDHLPATVQRHILQKELKFWVIDATTVAREAGLGRRINTVMQACFFILARMLPADEALQKIRESIQKTYGRRGEVVVARNLAAVDQSQAAVLRVDTAGREVRGDQLPELAIANAPDFVRRVTAQILAGHGDQLPVSAFPPDGTFPTGTAKWEKRSIAPEIPIWDAEVCIECALCALVCPHAAIRTKAYEGDALADAPAGFPSRTSRAKEFSAERMTVQVAPDDCTGCGVCVDVCPAIRKDNVSRKAINMEPTGDHLERERINFETFLALPELERLDVSVGTIKGSQVLEPLFEFSGACAGCGETPYLKLLSQLFGDRLVIANATGCSSIYGGNLPTTPWSVNADGRGPTWNNSLFEDNAEFGLGMRLALDQRAARARQFVTDAKEGVSDDQRTRLGMGVLANEQDVQQRRADVADLLKQVGPDHTLLLEGLLPASVWIVGGDGWAYDIGFGGLDHVMASGRNVNILVLDTEVYSNTGGQASKATPLGAVAKFAAGGKAIGKKDLGMIAMAYGNVFVAQIAMGANPKQTVQTFMQAESYEGPSLIIAYSPCIAHGIDMSTSSTHTKDAVKSGYWPLFHFDPRVPASNGKGPFRLDSRAPQLAYRDFAMKEGRFAMLERSDPEASRRLMAQAQEEILQRWHLYEQMAAVDRGQGQETSS